MERKQFTFYESFASALRRIKKDADRAKAYDAICDYALHGTLPNVDSLSDSAAIAFELIKPTLDASAKKAKSGRAGGVSKQTASKQEANAKQTAREKEVEGEVEIEKENECYILSSSEERKESPSSFPPEKKKYGKYVTLTLKEFSDLLTEYGHTEFSSRIKAVDLPENEGKDFYALIREVPGL